VRSSASAPGRIRTCDPRIRSPSRVDATSGDEARKRAAMRVRGCNERKPSAPVGDDAVRASVRAAAGVLPVADATRRRASAPRRRAHGKRRRLRIDRVASEPPTRMLVLATSAESAPSDCCRSCQHKATRRCLCQGRSESDPFAPVENGPRLRAARSAGRAAPLTGALCGSPSEGSEKLLLIGSFYEPR